MKKIDGLDIVNAVKPLRIEVSANDVREGAPLNHNACAIAVACKRQLRGVEDVFVHLGRLYLKIKGQPWRRWEVPEYAKREITAFDRGGRFVPQEIDLRPISLTRLQRRVAAVRGGSKQKPKGPSRPRHYTVDVRGAAYSNEPPTRRKG